MSTNTEKQWRVQVRKSRAHKWVNKGLFETREDARIQCAIFRGDERYWSDVVYGFGNTRVIPYVKTKKGQR